ncbi:hypothetical protein [Roseisalinus antarcticus]|uniref:DUF304 domain-containing protein n=1 Tax=Roseisalinus antarcticus TaxID=254357 RepID=A0A1Y5T3W3_9RHOB|nr:hypothetical protein [Roseisalinus antarcticus]SLN54687.1 hypothetical protein ROA7023_02460 [Roseisalinus antarcticus]
MIKTFSFGGSAAPAARPRRGARPSARVDLDETYWGYVVRCDGWTAHVALAAQTVSWLGGLGAALFAAAVWLLPAEALAIDPVAGRAGAAGLIGGFACILFWLTTRGSVCELQVDLKLSEIREVRRSRGGRPRLAGRYGFHEIGGVHLDRATSGRGAARLLLRYGNSARTIPAAVGPVAELERLRDRIGGDLTTRLAPRGAA